MPVCGSSSAYISERVSYSYNDFVTAYIDFVALLAVCVAYYNSLNLYILHYITLQRNGTNL